MKIIILGAGQVGRTAAHMLAQEKHNDVTVVDLNDDTLRELQDRLDIRTVHGHAAHPSVLARAGAEDADMLIALTDSDETNMIACQIGYTLYHTPTKIARIRSGEYIGEDRLFGSGALAVDVRISPEQLVTEHIERLIQYPGALQVLDFADGRVRLVGAEAKADGLLTGHPIRDLRRHLPNIETRVAAIYRNGQSILPEGDTIVRAGDEVFFIAARKDIRIVMSEMRKLESPVRRVFIAGGGNIGFRLARRLERTNQVKLIERSRKRAKEISEQLERCIVLNGDAADEELLMEENVDEADVFCAVTNAEEANILSAMLAKRRGAKKVLALINRPAYTDLVEAGTIDIAISPQQVTIGSLLRYVRRGDVVRVHTLRRGAAEAIEAIAHGSPESSRVVGRRIEDIDLPSGATIAAIVRSDEVIMAHHDTEVHADDHLIIFVNDRTRVGAVEKLFEVAVTFV
jgi:trk system potassium uptake protein TrkA